MVINTAKQEFSARLNAIEFPARARQTRLAEYMTKLGHKVVAKGARKWLVGESIPSHEKIIAICNDTKASPMWLEYGVGEMFGDTSNLSASIKAPSVYASMVAGSKPSKDEEESEVFKALSSLPADQQKLALDVLKAVLKVLRGRQ